MALRLSIITGAITAWSFRPITSLSTLSSRILSLLLSVCSISCVYCPDPLVLRTRTARKYEAIISIRDPSRRVSFLLSLSLSLYLSLYLSGATIAGTGPLLHWLSSQLLAGTITRLLRLTQGFCYGNPVSCANAGFLPSLSLSRSLCSCFRVYLVLFFTCFIFF